MLTSALRALVKDPVKKSFYRKRKKTINVLTFFLFPIKVMSKLSLIRFLTSIPRILVSISLDENMKYSNGKEVQGQATFWFAPHKSELPPNNALPFENEVRMYANWKLFEFEREYEPA